MTGSLEILYFVAKLAASAAYGAKPGWEAHTPDGQIDCRFDGQTAFCTFLDATVTVTAGCRQLDVAEQMVAVCAGVTHYQGQPKPSKPVPIHCTFAKEGDMEPVCAPGPYPSTHAGIRKPKGHAS